MRTIEELASVKTAPAVWLQASSVIAMDLWFCLRHTAASASRLLKCTRKHYLLRPNRFVVGHIVGYKWWTWSSSVWIVNQVHSQSYASATADQTGRQAEACSQRVHSFTITKLVNTIFWQELINRLDSRTLCAINVAYFICSRIEQGELGVWVFIYTKYFDWNTGMHASGKCPSKIKKVQSHKV